MKIARTSINLYAALGPHVAQAAEDDGMLVYVWASRVLAWYLRQDQATRDRVQLEGRDVMQSLLVDEDRPRVNLPAPQTEPPAARGADSAQGAKLLPALRASPGRASRRRGKPASRAGQ